VNITLTPVPKLCPAAIYMVKLVSPVVTDRTIRPDHIYIYIVIKWYYSNIYR